MSHYYEEGHAKLPDKIKLLGESNATLAHQPWLFSCEHLTTLLDNGW
jgi:hypothetical protein